MRLSAVVAASDNDVIGRDNALPWHQPADLAYFKRVTMGKPMLMGRKTYESIGRPLPGRRNLVLTRGGFSAPGIEVVASIEEALARTAGAAEMMVIGGAEVFRLAMPWLDHMHLTRVHTVIDGDVFLPRLAPGDWREVRREDHPADARNPLAMTFIELERVRH
ncbi:MAG: dihydrofolate reductase [Steroidobacteraceae bacterium]